MGQFEAEVLLEIVKRRTGSCGHWWFQAFTDRAEACRKKFTRPLDFISGFCKFGSHNLQIFNEQAQSWAVVWYKNFSRPQAGLLLSGQTNRDPRRQKFSSGNIHRRERTTVAIRRECEQEA